MFDDIIAKLGVALSMDAAQFATGSTSAQKELAQLQRAVQTLGDKWMQAGKRLSIGVSAPLVAIGLASAKAASDAQELDSAFGQTFGRMAADMREWSEATGDALNRSTQEIKRAANAFGGLFNAAAPTREEAARMSQTFTVLAQDLASFFNVSESDALQKLLSGLSGETEPLRDFQVFINEAAVSQKALQLGLAGSTKELTEQDKILARYNLILEGTRVAQGDVTRTSESAANQARGFTGALTDLQVVIGDKLLPLLTPFIEAATNLVNGFANLPSPVQNIVIGFAALAAAMGPLMLIVGTLAATLLPLFAANFGPVGLAISAFINPLGTAISLLVQFIARVAGMAILQQIGGLLLRFAGPVGVVASLGLLIYKNWDRISDVLSEFWQAAQEALGPPLQELIKAVSDLMSAFWDSGFGDAAKAAQSFVLGFGSLVMDVFGEVLVRTLRGALQLIINVFDVIGGVIMTIAKALQGDFAGAWDAMLGVVRTVAFGFLRIVTAVFPEAGTYIIKFYTEVKTWLQDKLGAVFDWVGKKVKAVTGFFFEMYDAVVGNSYVPDMVEEIGIEFARLQGLMVDPARKATRDVTELTREMARDVGGLLDRLFPQFAAARRQAEDLALLDKAAAGGLISDDLRRRARVQLLTGGDKATVSEGLLSTGPLVDFAKQSENLQIKLGGLADNTEMQTVRIAESFRDMAQNSVRALEDMVNSIKGGGFLDILGSAVNLFLQLGSTGLFGKKLAAKLNSARIPGFAQGTNFAPGGLAWVGERGPELVNLPRGSQVISNRDLRAANDRGGRLDIRVGVDPRTGNLLTFVDQRVGAVAPAIAGAGAAMAQGQMAAQARRRFR